jgi:hypothetical protein
LQGTRSAEHNFALALVRVDRQAIAAEPYSIAVARTACSTPCMAARASRSFPTLTKAAKHEMSSFIAIGNGKERASFGRLLSDREDTRIRAFPDLVHQNKIEIRRSRDELSAESRNHVSFDDFSCRGFWSRSKLS